MTFAVTVEIASGTTDVDATTEPTLLYGWSFRETAGTPAAARVIIRDGNGDNLGDIVAVVDLDGTGSTSERSKTVSLAVPIRCNSGVRVERESGTAEGAVWTESD